MHGRRHQHDRTAPCHQRQQLLHEKDGAASHEVERLVEMLGREGVDGSLLRKARVRHDDVDSALFFPHHRSDTVEVIQVRGVSLNRCDVASDQSGGLIKLRFPAAEDKHVSTFSDEALGDRQTDTACCAANDGNLACESGHCDLLPVRE
jgi:hypothetical protein